MAGGKIRVGIIGANAHYGWSMRAHLPALRALSEFELTAVCTAHKETAEESAKHYGARLAFHDYREMVVHPDIDLVTVSVRAPYHHRMTMAALSAGNHVFCEWPLGTNLAEVEDMASLAQEKGVRTLAGLQGRFDPVLLRLQELLAENYVGEVLACNVTLFLPGLLEGVLDRAWRADWSNGTNTLTIAAGHAIDALCFCVGEFQELSALSAVQVPVWETGQASKAVKVTAPDNVLVNGVLTNGAVVSVHVATVPSHGSSWRMQVHGREGTLIASVESPEQRLQYSRIRLQGGRGQDRQLQDLTIPERLTWVPSEVPQGPPFNVAQMYRRLGQAIREGKSVDSDFGQAVQRLRLLYLIQHASDQGEKQKITV